MLYLPTLSGRAHLPLGTILRRIALPVLLFALVLTSLLTASWLLLLPQLTEIEIGGSVLDTSALKAYERELDERLSALERERDELVLPMEGTLYDALTTVKHNQRPLLPLRAQVIQAALHLVPGNKDAVSIDSLRYLTSGNRIEVTGDIRNVGPRSMTVLAQFAEVLRGLPFVADLQRPRFTRKDDPTIGMYSPFTLNISLQ